MALTNLSQITTSGIATLTDINLNNITGVAATFTGNVTVGGTLTYDDVTNIDSVGLITARSGIIVATGTATTALVVEGDARITGILTVGSSSLTLDGTNNVVNVGTALTLGHTQGLQFHTQNLHSQGFEINNVNATGIVTATTFIGNLTGTASNASGATSDFSIADKIVHTGDTDTAIRFPANDTFTVETAGSERLRITSDGKVGIGTDDPQVTLQLGKPSDDNTIIKMHSSSAAYLQFSSIGTKSNIIAGRTGGNSDLAFWSSSGGTNYERMRIKDDGNVGIGTDSPDFKLHSNETGGSSIAGLFETNQTDAYISFQASGTTASSTVRIGAVGDNFQAFVNGAERLRINSAGNVGIGEDSPDVRLHVKEQFDTAYSLANVADEANHLLKLENPSTTANAFSGMQFRVGSGADLFFGAIQQTTNHGDFFFANQNSPQKEMMRIKSTGNIGIGLTNPGALLHLESTAANAARLRIGFDSPRYYDIFRGSTTNSGYLNFYGSQSSYVGYTFGGVDGERMRIKSNGKVGIGTDNPSELLHLQSGWTKQILKSTNLNTASSLIFDTHNINTADYLLGQLAGRWNGNDVAYINFEAGADTTNKDDGVITFLTSPSSSTPTERLRITAAGRVLVGHHNEVAGAYDNTAQTKQLQIINGLNSGDQGLGIYSFSSAGWAPRIELAASRSTSFGGHTVVTDGQSCGLMVFNGSDGTNFSTAAMISANVNGTPANDSIPGSLSFHTSPGAGLVERLRITSAGKLHLKATGGSGVIADFQEGTSATDSEALISVTTGYSSGSNEGSVRFGSKRAGNGNSGHFILSTRAGGSNISNGWYTRFMVKDNGQIQFNTHRAIKYSNEGASTSMYNFRLAINMTGSTVYTIRLRGMSNGAHHVRLMGSHWTGGYQLIKESYYYTNTYEGLSETSIHNMTSNYQGAWSVSRPSSGQTGYTTDLIITKSAGSYGGGHIGMIDIKTNSDLYLVSIT